MEEIIAKIEKELDFQRKQAREYQSGIFKNEVVFARYDQAIKAFEWVLDLLKERREEKMNEDKQLICTLLLLACKATRGASDLASLEYDKEKEVVTATFTSGGKRRINVAMDSGTAMIRDIMNKLEC